jgi:hypothetical protein
LKFKGALQDLPADVVDVDLALQIRDLDGEGTRPQWIVGQRNIGEQIVGAAQPAGPFLVQCVVGSLARNGELLAQDVAGQFDT